jgi:DNA replication protein DnaC
MKKIGSINVSSIHIRPRLFIIDEVGYLPLDRLEATLLFQLISGRYEKGEYHHHQ